MISPDVFSIILLSDNVPGRSLLVISPDVISIILLLDCVPGRSLLVISPVVFSIILLLDCVPTGWITSGDFNRYVPCDYAMRFEFFMDPQAAKIHFLSVYRYSEL